VPSESIEIYTPFIIQWKAPTNRDPYDRIGFYLLYPATGLSKGESLLSYEYINNVGQETGFLTFSIEQVGSFYFKYLGSTNEVINTSSILNSNLLGFSVEIPEEIYLEESFLVFWQAPVQHNVRDLVALKIIGTDGTEYFVDSRQIESPNTDQGVIKFIANYPGNYFVTYVLSSGTKEVYRSSNFSILISNYQMITPSSVFINEMFNIVWSSSKSHNPSDTIELFQLQNDNSWKLISPMKVGGNGTASGTLSFTVSATGSYRCGYNLASNLYGYLFFSTPFNATSSV